MPKRNGSREALLEWFGPCISKAIGKCLTIFRGCPQVTQLVVPTLHKLGYEAIVLTGKVSTYHGDRVTHIWVEVPELGLRVETNPSQILGWPSMAVVMPIEEETERYEDATQLEDWNHFPALFMTPAGEAYFDRMSDKVIACLHDRAKKKR